MKEISNDYFYHFLIDSAYFSEDSYDHMIVTTWIPLLDTNSNNGCMQVGLITKDTLPPVR